MSSAQSTHLKSTSPSRDAKEEWPPRLHYSYIRKSGRRGYIVVVRRSPLVAARRCGGGLLLLLLPPLRARCGLPLQRRPQRVFRPRGVVVLREELRAIPRVANLGEGAHRLGLPLPRGAAARFDAHLPAAEEVGRSLLPHICDSKRGRGRAVRGEDACGEWRPASGRGCGRRSAPSSGPGARILCCISALSGTVSFIGRQGIGAIVESQALSLGVWTRDRCDPSSCSAALSSAVGP